MISNQNIPRSSSGTSFTWKLIIPMVLVDVALVALFVMEKISMPMLVGGIVATGIVINIAMVIGKRFRSSGLSSGGITGSAEILSTSVLAAASSFSKIDFQLNVRVPGRPSYQLLHTDVVPSHVAEMIKQGKLRELVISAHRNNPRNIKIEWDRVAAPSAASSDVPAGAATCGNCSSSVPKGYRFCPHCGSGLPEVPVDADEIFTAENGTPGTYGSETTAHGPPEKKKPTISLFISIAMSLVVGGAMIFFFSSKGCSEVTGIVTMKGHGSGQADMVAHMCRSGQHRNFFGVVVVGDGPNTGGIKLVQDPMSGWNLVAEVPGSCRGPNGGDPCTVMTFRSGDCRSFDADVHYSGIMVNEIRLLSGHLKAECSSSQGTISADLVFKKCD